MTRKFLLTLFMAIVTIGLGVFVTSLFSSPAPPEIRSGGEPAGGPLARIRYPVGGPPPKMEPGAEYVVSEVEVLDGHEFYVACDAGPAFHARLTAVSGDDGEEIAVQLLRSAETLRVKLLRRCRDGVWAVSLDLEGPVEGNMLELLENRNGLLDDPF